MTSFSFDGMIYRLDRARELERLLKFVGDHGHVERDERTGMLTLTFPPSIAFPSPARTGQELTEDDKRELAKGYLYLTRLLEELRADGSITHFSLRDK